MEKDIIKNIVILILSIGVFLLGYIVFFEKVENNDIFDNNIKCSKYIESEKEKINNSDINNLYNKNIEQVFYSPKLNSCISAIYKDGYIYGTYEYILENILTGEKVFYQKYIRIKGESSEELKNIEMKRKKFEDKIKELKEE